MKEIDWGLLPDKLEQPDILGKEKYFNSAVLLPLVEQNGEYHFLFQKRAKQISQAGEVCFPGGRYEPELDTNYLAAALREAEEELGITSEMVAIKGRLDTLIATMGATVDSFVGICNLKNINELEINPSEVEDVFTLPISYFYNNEPANYKVKLNVKPYCTTKQGEEITLLPVEELGLPDRYRKAWGGRKDDIYVYQTDQGIIWGITAQLIIEFITNITDKSFHY